MKDTVIYGLASSVQKLIPLFTLPIITKHLGKAAVSTYDISFVYAMLFSWFVILGQDSAAASYYFDKENSAATKSKIVSYSLYIQLLSMVIMLSGIFLSRKLIAGLLFKGDANLQYFWSIALAMIPGHILLNYTLSVLRWNLKSVQYMCLCLFNTVATIVTVVGLVKFLNGSIKSIFIAYILSLFLTGLGGLWLIRKQILVKVAPVDFAMVRRLILFGLPFALSSFFNQLIPAIDRTFLLHFHYSGSALAEYGLGVRLGGFIALITSSFAMAVVPYVMSIWNDENSENQVSQIFVGSSCVMFASIPVILIFKGVLMAIFTDGTYGVTAQLLPFFFFGWVFDMLIYFGMLGIYRSRKAVPALLILISGTIVSAILNLLCIPVFGVYGAAFAFACAKLVLFIINCWYSRRYFRLSIHIKTVGPVLLFSIALSVVAYWVPVAVYCCIVPLSVVALFFLLRNQPFMQKLSEIVGLAPRRI